MATKLINGSGARIDVHAHAFTPEFTRVLRKSVSRPLAIRSIWEWDENRFLGEMDRWECHVTGSIIAPDVRVLRLGKSPAGG